MRVLVVDDEAPARERLRQLLDDVDGYDCVGEAGNGEEALKIVPIERPDIILLDIRMPGLGGIETAHHLNKLANPPAVVFTTAYDEYAIEAFEAQAIGYVLKPVRRARLEAALQQASRLKAGALQEVATSPGLAEKRRHVCAQTGDQLVLIPIEDIAFFRADQKYVSVYHTDGVNLIDESLKALEEEFGDDFVRVHRAALVALRAIERIDKTADGKSQIVLRGDSQGDDRELTISRRHVAEVRRRLKGA